ncbi:MAG TPA: hypothetical protein VMA83_02315 [Solirubrobacteraceae bacterium]|nr:hypothetical protein [Solirubrobacteraceae bacterium]
MTTIDVRKAHALAAVGGTVFALALLAAPAGASARRANICVDRHGAMTMRYGACTGHGRRLDVTRARGASSGGSVIYTCVNRKGQLRLVKRSTRCKRGEKKLTWGVEGPRGPRGEAGPPGGEGKQGKEGTPGSNGVSKAYYITTNKTTALKEGTWKHVEGLTFEASGGAFLVTAVVKVQGLSKKITESSTKIECRLGEEYPERGGPEFHVIASAAMVMAAFKPVVLTGFAEGQIVIQAAFYPEFDDELRVECNTQEYEMNESRVAGGTISAVETNSLFYKEN